MSTKKETVPDERMLFQCPICSLGLTTRINLKNHVAAAHEGKTPFSCRICNKTFSEKYSMENHIRRIHEGRKLYSCPKCDKGFTQASNLKLHIKTIHEGKKPFECEFCDFKFAHKIQLRKHTELVHHSQRFLNKRKCDISDQNEMAEELEFENRVSCDNVKIELLENAVHEKKKPLQCQNRQSEAASSFYDGSLESSIEMLEKQIEDEANTNLAYESNDLEHCSN